ncbi:MAG: 3-dehydroquinate synthase [Gammaproteobacteria bacterium]|nr:3-dehydroquinate synthase [Gammaproteobacteria bacterium]
MDLNLNLAGSNIMLQLKTNIPDAESQGLCGSISQVFSTNVDYKIHFTENVFSLSNPVLERALVADTRKITSFICFVDTEVLASHEQLVENIQLYAENSSVIKLLTRPIPVKGGEGCKNDPQALHDLYSSLLKFSVDRHNCIVAIGGGAVLDLVGYAAATAHRGVRLIRLPTTVLSQNDSGIGVKNGINFLDRKNYLGTFSPPDSVICDFSFLQTLSERDKRAGMAEAIKVSLIRDGEFFDWLENNCAALADFDMDPVSYSIKCSAEIHAKQISTGGDPFEKGSNRPLDYGHWLAHKLEVMSDYEVKHGEAVAIGMLVDARYSYEMGLFSEVSLLRVKNLIMKLGFKLWHSSLDDRDINGEYTVFQGMEEFREHLGGELSITLLKRIGAGTEVHEIDLDIMRSSLNWTKKCFDMIS